MRGSAGRCAPGVSWGFPTPPPSRSTRVRGTSALRGAGWGPRGGAGPPRDSAPLPGARRPLQFAAAIVEAAPGAAVPGCGRGAERSGGEWGGENIPLGTRGCGKVPSAVSPGPVSALFCPWTAGSDGETEARGCPRWDAVAG